MGLTILELHPEMHPGADVFRNVDHALMIPALKTSSFSDYGLSDSPFPFTSPSIVLVSCLVYLFVVLTVSPKDNNGESKRAVWLTYFTRLHNLVMMVFSLVVFLSVTPVVVEGAIHLRLSAGDLLCVQTERQWDTLGFWSWMFYLSKYYEFVDTFLIIVRNRRPTTLQYYHHAGAVMVMWAMVTTRAPGMLPFVFLNSFIHTVMYGYYLATTFRIKWIQKATRKFRLIVTSMQILQFISGFLWTATTYFIKDCLNEGQEVVTVFTHFYVILLCGMFIQFFYESNLANRKKL